MIHQSVHERELAKIPNRVDGHLLFFHGFPTTHLVGDMFVSLLKTHMRQTPAVTRRSRQYDTSSLLTILQPWLTNSFRQKAMLPLLSMNSQSLFVNCVNGNHPLSGKCMLKPRNDKSICIARALYFEPSQCNCHWPIGWYYAVFSVAEHGPTVQSQEFVGGRICGRRSQNAGTGQSHEEVTHIYIYNIYKNKNAYFLRVIPTLKHYILT